MDSTYKDTASVTAGNAVCLGIQFFVVLGQSLGRYLVMGDGVAYLEADGPGWSGTSLLPDTVTDDLARNVFPRRFRSAVV